MIELRLRIRYVKGQGWVAWLIYCGDPEKQWTPVEGFHDTPLEAAQEALDGLPDLLDSLLQEGKMGGDGCSEKTNSKTQLPP